MRRWIAGTILAGTVATGGTTAVLGADARQNPYEDKGTHFELPLKSDIPQGERVEIAKDKAQMTMRFWNDEEAITITPQIPTALLGAKGDRPFTVPANRKLLSKKMEFKSGDITAFIEPKVGTQNEFDIDFTLESKPDTNVFTYKIEGAEDFDFFYQPELTPEEITEGASQPENVVRSYAVYHKTKANYRVGSTNYTTGKAFHIYRPKAIDTKGNEIWAQLEYADGVLTVTVPQDFLQEAAYPVLVDPTFGKTSIGSTSFTVDSDDLICWRGTVVGTGNVTHISVWKPSIGTGSHAWRGAIYDDQASPNLDTTGQGDESTWTPGTSGWATSTFSGGTPTLTASTVRQVCAFWNADASNAASMRRDAVDIDATFDTAGTYPTFPDPAGTGETTASYTIYATYTADAGGTPPTAPPQDMIILQ